MAYYLEKSETFPEGIKRIGIEQNNMAIDALATDDNLHNGIHKARKHFKKLRALFRLIRDEVGYKLYKQGDVFYRNMGRNLSGLRDITSRIETVDRLERQYGHTIDAENFEKLRGLLEEERQAMASRETESEESSKVEATINRLQEERGRFLQLSLRDRCIKNTITSLHRVYLRGHKGFKKSLGNPSVKEMHEWRKQVKYLWYHYRLLRQAWPRVFKAYKKETKVLADFLGDYHDLALLINKMDTYREQLPQETHHILSSIAEERKNQLLEEARQLGALVYNAPPKAFAKKMRGLLEDHLL